MGDESPTESKEGKALPPLLMQLLAAIVIFLGGNASSYVQSVIAPPPTAQPLFQLSQGEIARLEMLEAKDRVHDRELARLQDAVIRFEDKASEIRSDVLELKEMIRYRLRRAGKDDHGTVGERGVSFTGSNNDHGG